jgi:membrane-associated phospholipid phosphatase
VAASRILLNAHHLSDVVTSIAIAIPVASLICSRFAPSVLE